MMQYNNQAAQQAASQMMDLERELLAMRGQYERDQLMLEQYDRVSAIMQVLDPSLLTKNIHPEGQGSRE